MPKNFVSALKKNSLEVQKLEIASGSDLVRVLGDLQDRLRGRIAASTSADRVVDASVLQQMLNETRVIIRELEQQAGGLFGTAQKDASELAAAHLVDEIKRLSRAFEEQAITVDVNMYEVLRDPPQRLLADHFESSVNRYGQDLLNGVRRELILSLRTGDTVGAMAGRIAGMRGPMGAIGRDNAKRLMRTEVSQAYGAAHHSSMRQAEKEVPSLKKVWLHIGSYLCAVCGPLHGTERPLDGTWTIRSGRKTRQVAYAPGHPNCVCRTSGMRPSWRKGLMSAGYLKEQPTTDEPGRAAL